MSASAERAVPRPQTTEHIVVALRHALADRTDVSLAVLFGSVARGSVRDDAEGSCDGW